MLKDSARNPPSAAVRAPRAKPGTAADGPSWCSSVLAGLGRGTGNPVWHCSTGLGTTQEKHHCLSHGKSTSLCTSPIFIPVRQGNGQENPSYKELPSKGAHKQCTLSPQCLLLWSAVAPTEHPWASSAADPGLPTGTILQPFPSLHSPEVVLQHLTWCCLEKGLEGEQASTPPQGDPTMCNDEVANTKISQSQTTWSVLHEMKPSLC